MFGLFFSEDAFTEKWKCASFQAIEQSDLSNTDA